MARKRVGPPQITRSIMPRFVAVEPQLYPHRSDARAATDVGTQAHGPLGALMLCRWQVLAEHARGLELGAFTPR